MQPVPAFTTKNFNYLLQAAHHFDTICCSCWLRCSLNSRWVLPTAVVPKTSGRNQISLLDTLEPAHPSQEITVKMNYTIRVKSLCPLGFIPIQWTIKRQFWIANPVTETFDSSQEWEHVSSSVPNTQIRSHQMYLNSNCLQAPEDQKSPKDIFINSFKLHTSCDKKVCTIVMPYRFLNNTVFLLRGFLICTTESYLCIEKIKIVKAYKISTWYSFCHYQGRSMRNKDKLHL